MIRARRVSAPRPTGTEQVKHADLERVLKELATDGIGSLPANRGRLSDYALSLSSRSPDAMPAGEALAFWINLYNAGALHGAGETVATGATSVLRVPGLFTKPWVTVEGETLSSDDIEHGKIRRFGDPRIHAALVCGSASCPGIRYEPFTGDGIDEQLDSQMRSFLSSGAASIDRASNTISLSRIFSWYGKDFTRPDLMPNMIPASSSLIRDTIAWWLDADDREYVWAAAPSVRFMPYDWSVACAVSPLVRTTP